MRARAYKFTAKCENGEVYSFIDSKPTALLTPIWKDIKPGVVTLTVDALDDDGTVLFPVGLRTFYKSVPFQGRDAYKPKKREYRECAKMALNYVYEQPFTDKTRFYSSGISMGGYTAYQLMMSRPQMFTAGIVCCGGGMYWNASRLRDIPLRIFHGAQDKVVFPCESENMTKKINECGGNATLTIYSECEHNCWDKVYTNKENFEWLLNQRKSL